MSRRKPIPEAVTVLATEFAEWRRRKRHAREPIPELLWSKAMALGRKHPLSMVARQLGLTSRLLVARMEAAAPKVPRRSRPIRMAQLVVASPAAPLGPAPSPALEIVSPTGARLRVASGDLREVVKAFVEACR